MFTPTQVSEYKRAWLGSVLQQRSQTNKFSSVFTLHSVYSEIMTEMCTVRILSEDGGILSAEHHLNKLVSVGVGVFELIAMHLKHSPLNQKGCVHVSQSLSVSDSGSWWSRCKHSTHLCWTKDRVHAGKPLV